MYHQLFNRGMLAFLCLSALCGAITSHVVHEKRDLSSTWEKRAKVPSNTRLHARIALTQRNLENGHDYIMDIADPKSSNYGKHWTPQQIGKTFTPSDLTYNAAVDWLAESGIAEHRITSNKHQGFLSLDVTTKELENLLQAEYYVYHHAQLQQHAIACDQYHVPSHMRQHIDFITPGVGLSSKPASPSSERRHQKHELHQKRQDVQCQDDPISLNRSLENCGVSAAPECLNALYSIPKPSKHNPMNTFGIFQLDVSYVQTDMDKFFETVAPQIPVGTIPKNVLLNGAQLTTNFSAESNDVEANLDFQMAWPLVYPHNLTLLDSNFTEAQLTDFVEISANASSIRSVAVASFQLLGNMLSSFDKSFCADGDNEPCGTEELPKVISISYAPDEIGLTEAESKRLCNEFLKLGLLGTTVIICTGDGGVANRLGQCIGPDQNVFNPGALVSCPWVTSVGASMIPAGASVYDPEIAAVFAAAPNLTSGGGFSNYFPAPQYQRPAVAEYFYNNPSPFPTYAYNGSLSSIGANGGRFNRLGRGFPDVSAMGNNLSTVNDGCLTGLNGGTSASTPIFASVIHLLNEERMAANKSTLGFINPVLYANPQVLTDISGGINYGCNFEQNGFEAVSGWDPVTGLGTPNYPRMKSLFMSLP